MPGARRVRDPKKTQRNRQALGGQPMLACASAHSSKQSKLRLRAPVRKPVSALDMPLTLATAARRDEILSFARSRGRPLTLSTR